MSVLRKSPRPDTAPGASSEGLCGAVIGVCAVALAEVVIGEVPVRVVRNMFDPNDHETPNMPSLLVRYIGGGLSTEGDRTETVELQFAFEQVEYGDDELGVSIMNRLMTTLMSFRTIGGRYRLELPLEWSIDDSEEVSKWPNWGAVMRLTYAVPTIADVSVEDMV